MKTKVITICGALLCAAGALLLTKAVSHVWAAKAVLSPGAPLLTRSYAFASVGFIAVGLVLICLAGYWEASKTEKPRWGLIPWLGPPVGMAMMYFRAILPRMDVSVEFPLFWVGTLLTVIGLIVIFPPYYRAGRAREDAHAHKEGGLP